MSPFLNPKMPDQSPLVTPSRSGKSPRIFLIGIIGICGIISGTDSSWAENILSWDTCVTETALNNPEIKSSLESLQSQQFNENAAFSGYFPQVTGTAAYTYGTGTTSTGASSFASLNGNAVKNYNLSLAANENLFSGFLDQAKVDQASANVRLAEITLETTKSKLSADLRNAFAALLFAQRSLTLEEEIIRRRKENLKLVSLRFQSGRENKGSVLLSQAYLNEANYHFLQAAGKVQTARAQLARILGRDEDEEFTVSESLPTELPPAQPLNFSALKQIATLTPDHKQSVAQEDVARANLQIAQAGFYPTLGVSANTGRSGQEWFPETERWSIGATLSFPLFSGGKDYFGSKAASASLRASGATRENTDRLTLTHLRETYTAWVEAHEKLKVDQSFKDAALKRSEIARSKYNNGLMTFEDWDLIENDLISRETAVLQSQRDRAAAEASWKQTQGLGVFK